MTTRLALLSWPNLIEDLESLLIVGPLVVVVLFVVHRVLARSTRAHQDAKFRYQLIMAALTAVGLLAILFALPIETPSRNALLSLFGILMSAAIALSSTNLLGNAMAGVMLRVVKNFKFGDFVRVGEHFGRVSERGLFHTEIQTEDRDLTTLPNLYLISNPMTVVRPSGTVLSANVSLGYDAPRDVIERELQAAAVDAGLEDPFLQVLDLGDYSVTYRIAGMLRDVSQIVSSRSNLRKRMLDHLHGAEIEIVSPTFMNTHEREPGSRVLPVRRQVSEDVAANPESLIFDKAEEAAAVERLQREHANALVELAQTEELLRSATEKRERKRLASLVERHKQHADNLVQAIESARIALQADREGDDTSR